MTPECCKGWELLHLWVSFQHLNLGEASVPATTFLIFTPVNWLWDFISMLVTAYVFVSYFPFYLLVPGFEPRTFLMLGKEFFPHFTQPQVTLLNPEILSYTLDVIKIFVWLVMTRPWLQHSWYCYFTWHVACKGISKLPLLHTVEWWTASCLARIPRPCQGILYALEVKSFFAPVSTSPSSPKLTFCCAFDLFVSDNSQFYQWYRMPFIDTDLWCTSGRAGHITQEDI